MSTGTVARFLASHAVWNIGGREVGGRYGRLSGTGAAAICRPDGLDFAFAFNRSIDDADYTVLRAQIDAILDQHNRSVAARVSRLFYRLTLAARVIVSILRGRWDYVAK